MQSQTSSSSSGELPQTDPTSKESKRKSETEQSVNSSVGNDTIVDDEDDMAVVKARNMVMDEGDDSVFKEQAKVQANEADSGDTCVIS